VSASLYDLGRATFRRRGLVVAVWAAILVIIAAGAMLFGKDLDNTFSIPGSESQDAMNELAHIVPSMTGAQAQIIVIPPDGTLADAPSVQTAVNSFITKTENVDRVNTVTSPYDSQSTAPSLRRRPRPAVR